jgi:hypothetical protein
MTIRRGQDWGDPGPLDHAADVQATDADAAASLQARRTAGVEVPEVGLLGGDLHRTLGGPGRGETELRTGMGVRYPVDLIEVEATAPDGTVTHHTGLAHLEVRGRRRFAGRTVVVMNASFVGPANLGPRAHPNDGRLDVTEGALPRRVWRDAARRALTGTHVPHPDLVETRTAELVVEDVGRRGWWLDGVKMPQAVRLVVRCRPDAAVVVA